jgi:hypothetical protein
MKRLFEFVTLYRAYRKFHSMQYAAKVAYEITYLSYPF